MVRAVARDSPPLLTFLNLAVLDSVVFPTSITQRFDKQMDKSTIEDVVIPRPLCRETDARYQARRKRIGIP